MGDPCNARDPLLRLPRELNTHLVLGFFIGRFLLLGLQ